MFIAASDFWATTLLRLSSTMDFFLNVLQFLLKTAIVKRFGKLPKIL